MPEVIQRAQPLLLQLDLFSDAAIDDVTRPLALPPVPVELDRVVELLERGVDAFLADLRSPDQEALRLRGRLRAASEALSRRLAPRTSASKRVVGTSETYAGLRQITAQPALGRTPLAALGATYMLAWLDGEQVSISPVRAICAAIRRQVEWLASDEAGAGAPSWLHSVLHAARSRIDCIGEAGAIDAAGFNLLLADHCDRARDFPDHVALAGQREHAGLHATEVVRCTSWLREAASMRGDDAALVAAAAIWIGLPIQLGLDMPLFAKPGFAAHIDLEVGGVHVDLTALLAALAQPVAGAAGTSDRLVRPMPVWLLRALRHKCGGRPDLHLRDLLGRQSLGLRTCIYMAGSNATATFSRLMRHRARPLLDAGLDAAVASYVTLDIPRLAKATRHYCHVSAGDLRGACEQWSQALGWGPTAALDLAPGIGSRVSPLNETLKACIDELQRQVEAARPGRRSSVPDLVRFHNAYVGYQCFFLALVLGLRDRKVYDLTARLLQLGARACEVRDKAVEDMPPVVLSGTATELLRLWKLHCWALRRRLKNAAQRSSALVPSAWLRWLDALERRGRTPLLALLHDRGIRPAGTADWKRALDAATTPLTAKADFGRHWLPGVLRAAGLATNGIERALRHVVPGHEVYSSHGGIASGELECDVAAAIDEAVARLGLKACPGLTKWPT